jgi:homospermidine synthase
MREPSRRTLIVGWRGGVGRAVLGLLAHHPYSSRLLAGRELVLLDAEPGPDAPPLPNSRVLASARIDDVAALDQLLRGHAVDELVDLAGLDWRACIAACERFGTDYLVTSLERWQRPDDDLLADACALVAGTGLDALQRSHVLDTGMNPGCVNALCSTAIESFARTAGVAPTPEALELAAILVTELDATECTPASSRFATTWSPERCLDELTVSHTAWVDRGQVRRVEHAPWQRRYRARCGESSIDGYLVPHDELVTLGAVYRGVELGYLYQPPAPTRAHLGLASTRAGDALRMWPPHVTAVHGRDRVGVLLVSRRFGELWCGFDTDCAAAAVYGTNATLLQVAAGVLAGWAQLGMQPGARVVEQLDVVAYLHDVIAVLGEPVVFHDPGAPFIPLVDRAC